MSAEQKVTITVDASQLALWIKAAAFYQTGEDAYWLQLYLAKRLGYPRPEDVSAVDLYEKHLSAIFPFLKAMNVEGGAK